jgi:hypothetical protein
MEKIWGFFHLGALAFQLGEKVISFGRKKIFWTKCL